MENLMVDETLDETQQEKLLSMMKTLNRLKRIVHALLYISRIENDQFARNDVVNLHELLSEVAGELASRMEIKDLQFSLSISPTLSLHSVNRDLLFQLFYNFVNNAIKYNKEQGSIIIRDDQVAGEPYTLTIGDTGIGIAPTEISTMFNRFKKSSKSNSESVGLGLSIVKSIAVYHGFKLSVASKPGEGTVIAIEIPAALVKS